MKLWLAWLVAFSVVFTVAFCMLIFRGELGITGAAELALGPLGLLAVIATAFIARRRGRRWWLWLLFGVGLPFIPLLAVTLVGAQVEGRTRSFG